MSGVRVPAPPPRPASRSRLRRLEPILRRALAGPCRIRPGARILVAVSGGADSTALLIGLAAIAHETGLRLHVGHLNHLLRGAESDADAAFVQALAGRLGLTLHAARWDTRLRMRRRRLSGENGLRQLRREFLTGVARRIKADAIATAHTADDQLETVLFRLIRGTGLRGLGGMRARSGVWIKPMLEATRADVESDLRRARAPWRTDSTNAHVAFARNRLRLRAIPALIDALEGRTGRRVAASRRSTATAALATRVASLAAELRSTHAALAKWATSAVPTQLAAAKHTVTLDRPALKAVPRAVRRAAFAAAWKRLRPAAGLTRAHLDQLDRLAGVARGPVALPDGFEAVREAGLVRIRRRGIQDFRQAIPSRAKRSRGSGLTHTGRIPGGPSAARRS